MKGEQTLHSMEDLWVCIKKPRKRISRVELSQLRAKPASCAVTKDESVEARLLEVKRQLAAMPAEPVVEVKQVKYYVIVFGQRSYGTLEELTKTGWRVYEE